MEDLVLSLHLRLLLPQSAQLLRELADLLPAVVELRAHLSQLHIVRSAHMLFIGLVRFQLLVLVPIAASLTEDREALAITLPLKILLLDALVGHANVEE